LLGVIAASLPLALVRLARFEDRSGSKRNDGGASLWLDRRHLPRAHLPRAAAGIEACPAFRSVDRHGRARRGRMNARSVARLIKRAAEAAGLDPAGYAGHSLRAGFATQAFLNGAAEVSIMRQTRHKSLNTLRKYIRDRSLFRDNPAAKLGL